MVFPEFVLKNVLRRKVRTVLTTFGVAVAIAAVVALLSITRGYEQAKANSYAARGIDMVVSRAQVADRATSALDENIAKRIAEIPGVDRIAMSLYNNVTIDDEDLSRRLDGWPADSFAFNTLKVSTGRQLEAGDRHKAMLGSELAKELGKKVGDQVKFDGKPYEIVGIFSGGDFMEGQKVVVLLGDLQELMERVGLVNSFELAVDKNLPDRQESIAKIRHSIENLTDAEGNKLGLLALATQDFIDGDAQKRIAAAMVWVTSAIALLVGAVGMLNTMIVSVLERTQEIGILRAIGWRKTRIIRMIMAESFLLSLIGAISGTVLAAVLIQVLKKFPIAQRFVGGGLSPEVVAIGFALALLVGLVGGVYPALRGASLPPTEALRYE